MRTVTIACVLLIAQSTDALARQQPLFDFHSAFWMNLHHYLHALARPASPLSVALPSNVPAGERQQWVEAVDHYRVQYGKRSLLFDDEMLRIRQELGTAGSSGDLRDTALAADHRRILEAAAPIYRKYWWGEHDAANREFMTAVQRLLELHGRAIATRLAASFDAAWPETPIRVDLVHDAGPPGNAYTISEPTLITIGAGDPRHRGVAALELIFHEASHRWDAVLMKNVSDAARGLKLRAPPGCGTGCCSTTRAPLLPARSRTPASSATSCICSRTRPSTSPAGTRRSLATGLGFSQGTSLAGKPSSAFSGTSQAAPRRLTRPGNCGCLLTPHR
jgi:hypothetical protein